MQENGTDTGDRYKYKKVVPILDIGTNTEKQYYLKNGSSKGFKLFTTVK